MPQVPIDRHMLDNGLRVILSQDDRAPMVAVNLWYAVGSGHEEAGKTGFAHLFEHMMFQGSLHVQKGEHMSLVQGAGGSLNAGTDIDYTTYYETAADRSRLSDDHHLLERGDEDRFGRRPAEVGVGRENVFAYAAKHDRAVPDSNRREDRESTPHLIEPDADDCSAGSQLSLKVVGD